MEHHHFLMGTSTISMAIFDSKLFVYQRVQNMLNYIDVWLGTFRTFSPEDVRKKARNPS